MEVGTAQVVFEPPFHPYTEILLASVARHDRPRQDGAVDQPNFTPRVRPERGCPFQASCPRKLGPIFFQAEDGIRDPYVTGVQTCALPIRIHGLLCRLSGGFTRLLFRLGGAALGLFGFRSGLLGLLLSHYLAPEVKS